MPDKNIKKNLEYHFHVDETQQGWISDDGKGFNRGFAGDLLTYLINELYENGRLKPRRDYKIKISIEIKDNKTRIGGD